MDLFITPLFTIGPFQVVVIVVVALIVFGPVGLGKKLGNLVKGTGQGVKEFKKALEEGKEDEEKKEAESFKLLMIASSSKIYSLFVEPGE